MKWSSRVKVTVPSLLIRLFMVLAVHGVLRVCVWPRIGLVGVRGVWYDQP